MHALLLADGALADWLGELPIDELVAKAYCVGVGLSVAVVDASQPGPIDSAEAHCAWLA